ncbi:DUF3040 domain-containing protein [Nakamurella leprariae]|uniref:DUF3040 domain-containing protein n=1 Tax=Nakamurella leprariae TaxID=2803911 RepID=A0A938YEG1_9ACTN|nr:DUF3040 domain-containing protein [Nakamurella leprariae]MBM9466263.1 DUF3040 domain-containing protein [Nakamurella leprariae]
MALSDHERHQLAAMEQQLALQDPALAQRLRRRPRRVWIRAALALTLGASLLIAGLVTTAASVGWGLVLSLVGGALVGLGAWRLLRRWRPPSPH